MRATAKLALVDQISRELDARYAWDDVEAYLNEFGIYLSHEDFTNKAEYVKSAIRRRDITSENLIAMAEDLSISYSEAAIDSSPPRNWQNTPQFLLFISHTAKDKGKAMRLKECLKWYYVNAFVAHEDISPTVEWQAEIDSALRTMDAFVALHTPGFGQSAWAQQEIGFAVARRVKIISLKMGEDPAGFIARHQALPRRNRTAEEIAKEIHALLLADDRTAAKIKAALPF